MLTLPVLLTFALVGPLASWMLTGLLRRYAVASQLLDHPNARSAHSVPTPRGGGVAIVVSFSVLLVVLGALGYVDRGFAVATLGAGTLVAALGFADDHTSLPARWRFLGHAAAAAWILWWMGPLPLVPAFGVAFSLGLPGVVLAACYIVWSVNLFNFMDGIDGIASVEAITCSLAGALLWWWTGRGTEWVAAVVFAATVGGFLIWNFPPAKIFMGDAGSGFLGLMVALLSLWNGHSSPHLFWSWFILVGVFMVDATTTLIRRVRRGEKFHEAHRSHAYQYAARRLASHRTVTLAVVLINLFWLLPMATLVALGTLDGTTGVLIAYAPLTALAFRYKAGDRANQEG